MSNPAVITLASIRRSKSSGLQRIDIEDNIGESIHIHLNGLRIDLSISDFFGLAESLDGVFENLMEDSPMTGYRFDPYFLYRIRRLVPDLEKITLEKRRICDLKVLKLRGNTHGGRNGYCVPISVLNSPAYRFLAKKSVEFLNYKQDGYKLDNNVERLRELEDSIERGGYPVNGSYVVLFGKEEFVRDGQHRLAVLAKKYGFHAEIDVMVMHFRGSAWKLKPVRQLLVWMGRFLRNRISRFARDRYYRFRYLVSSV